MAMRPLRDEPLELLPAIVAVPQRPPRRRQGSPKRLPQLPLERNEVSFEAAMAKTVFELRRRRQSPRRRREPLTARQPQRPPELAGALRISFPAKRRGRSYSPNGGRSSSHHVSLERSQDSLERSQFSLERSQFSLECSRESLERIVRPDESPRHQFLRKGAGLLSQRVMAQQNRERWGRDWRDDEDASPSRPPLPFVADLVAKERERRQSISHRRPSVPMAIELSLSEVLGVQPSPLSLQTPKELNWEEPLEDESSWSASEIVDEKVRVQEWVKEPERRGMNAGQFEVFFSRFCGDVIYEELEEPPKPLCLPTTLCQRCVEENRKDQKVKDRSKRPRETNLYAVTELIIIPETRAEGVSYSELINWRGLQVDYFISHHWAEDFGEFVQSVLRHAIVAAPELSMAWKDVVYWCCAFANNQHQIALGETLQESPFYQALNSKHCKGTVMNLNQAATALDRIWCIYEVYLTHSLEKPFTLNFRLGPLVGVVQETKEKDSWVFHIFKMLQHIDVGQADATNPDDHKKIMGEIENFRSREGTGAFALNRIVKAMLGSQAIFTLARRGDLDAVRRALELDADPNVSDSLGIRPLTYAAGNGHEAVVAALIEGRADARARVGANEVLGMFAPLPAERRRCIETVRELDEKETEGVHSGAISKALLQHTKSRCQDLTQALDAANAGMRLEVVRELRVLLHALVEHSTKLLQGGQVAAGEDERQAIGKHSQSLAPYLADPDARVRLAVVEAVTSIGESYLHTLKVPKGVIPEENLHLIVDEALGQNVVHYAACQECPNALYMLATGVDWQLEPRALRLCDGAGRGLAHLAVAQGHMECLAMMVGEKKLPRSQLSVCDHEGRTAVHYAALKGDAATLRAFVDLGHLMPEELCVKDHSGQLPHHIAAANGFARFLGVLVNDCKLGSSALARPDGDGRTVAHQAAARPDAPLLRHLVEACGLDKATLHLADHWHRTPAHDAAAMDAPEVLQLLQDYGAPLHLPMGPMEPQIGAVAIVNQSSEVVAYLGNSYRLGRVHYVDRHQRMRFEYEKGTKDLETVELERCDLAPTPLVLAEKMGRKKAQEFLGNAWAPIANLSGVSREEIMGQARRGALPAGVLVSQGAMSAVEKFLEKGLLSAADLSKRDAMGCSCLHRAARTGIPEVVCSIVKLGTFAAEDFMAVDVEGWSVLHHAACAGRGACVEVILRICELPQEALGLPDTWGRTPVHLAADADASEVLEVFAKRLAPMHETMGRPVLEDGTVTLVQPREMYGMTTTKSRGDMSRKATMRHTRSLATQPEDSEDEGLFNLGRVMKIFNNDQVNIRHQSGFREGYVELERCTFCPTPVVLAERRGRFTAVQTIIDLAWRQFLEQVAGCAAQVGADPHLWDWEELGELLRSEALQGSRPMGALLGVKSECHPMLLRELIAAEVVTPRELLTPDMLGRTALHRAARGGQADALLAVKELSGALHEDLELVDLRGRGLLHHAVLSDDAETVRLAARLLPRTPEELAQGDSWHLTPVHLAATINGLDGLKVLMELGVPIDPPLGPAKFEIGAVVLVEPKRSELSEVETEAWRMAMVRAVTGAELTVKFPEERKETKGVLIERCEVAPTPRVLAERMQQLDVATKLREATEAFNQSGKRKMQGTGKFQQAAQAAQATAMGVQLMARSSKVETSKEAPKLPRVPSLARAASGPSSPKPKKKKEEKASSSARRRFKGAAMSVVAGLRVAK